MHIILTKYTPIILIIDIFYLVHNYLFVHLFQTRKGSDRLNKFIDIVCEVT